LEKGLRYSQLYNQVSDWELVKDGSFVFLKRRHRVIYPGSLVQLHFLAVTLMIKATLGISLSHGTLVSVSFSHARPNNDSALSRWFNCPVYYDQDYDGFSFPAAFLDTPLPTSDHALLAMMEAYLSGLLQADSPQETLPLRVQQFIRKNLGTSICNLEGVAHLLGQHPRALQRALKNEDTSFRELLSDVRQQVAEQYLSSSDIAFTDLSDILGYRNVSAFSRAFKEATGLSPQHWKDLRA